MNPNELLPIVAQISVTLAALSGVAGVIAPASSESIEDQEFRRPLLRDVAINGLFAMMLSLLPFLLEDNWRLFSTLAAIIWATGFFFVARELRLMEPARLKRTWIGPLITLVGLTLFIWNVVAPDAGSPTRYAAAVLCLLAIASLNFIFAVFVRTLD